MSIKSARQYLQDASARAVIVSQLTIDNCNEFIDMLGEVGESLPRPENDYLEDTCISIARLVDAPVFVSRTQSRRVIFSVGAEDLALQKISQLANAGQPTGFDSIAEKIVRDPQAITCAAEILRRSYLDSRNQSADLFKLSAARKKTFASAFATNVTEVGKRGDLLDQNRPGFILWTLARLAPQACPNLLHILKDSDPSLDRFALEFLSHSWDSSNGQAYGLPAEEAVTLAFWSLDEFKAHARKRLLDRDLEYPVRAAWQSVVDGKVHYGVDGSVVTR